MNQSTTPVRQNLFTPIVDYEKIDEPGGG
jgi:hypothetical protein